MTSEGIVYCAGCGDELLVGGDAHETWDGADLTFWCETHCPTCVTYTGSA